MDIFCEKMLKAKVPKVLTACIEIFTNCIKSYGNKCFKKKTLVGVVKAVMAAGIFGHRDKIVREAAKNLFVEIWNWENVAVRQVVESFEKSKEQMKKDIVKGWEAIGVGAKGKPARLFRSEDEVESEEEVEVAKVENVDSDVAEDEDDIDPWDVLNEISLDIEKFTGWFCKNVTKMAENGRKRLKKG